MTLAKNEKIKVEFKNVAKQFGDRVILKDFSLKVPEGKTVVVLGGSGTGKSVSIKCLLGLLTPDNGDILVDGESVINLKEKQQYKLMEKFGMLFQFGALFDSLTNWQNVAFALLEQGIKPAEAKKTAIEKLALVGLGPHVADLMPAEISGGMKKRVSLARAICTNPEIVLYDEPTTGLDPITADTIDRLIVEMRDKLNITGIAITHDMQSAFKIADYIALLYQGEIIYYDTVENTKTTDNPYIKQFINGEENGPIDFFGK
ncbi:MAG: putative ribonucleotide transport ATP-binding protein mkl [Proteobacteria bacterium]|nr:MAG: putative ribonucleotide transport ATP-binding protein mkl [Pseudomonadota bacterium]